MTFSRAVVAFLVVGAASAAATSLHAQTRVALGQTVRGSLTGSDATMGDGSHFDLFTFTGRSGQPVTITLRSSAFDAFLAVGRMSGGELQGVETDDDSAGGTDARVTFTPSANGEYTIRANSLSKGETGDYTLEISAGNARGSGPAPSGTLVPILLDSATTMMRSEGLLPRGEVQRGLLATGAHADLSVTISAGATLAFVGVCDAGCSDLDMVVYGPDGAEAGSDVLPDDAPMVAVEGARPGTYRVRVTMAACSTARCEFGVRAFGR